MMVRDFLSRFVSIKNLHTLRNYQAGTSDTSILVSIGFIVVLASAVMTLNSCIKDYNRKSRGWLEQSSLNSSRRDTAQYGVPDGWTDYHNTADFY
jgi:hypothetical protein